MSASFILVFTIGVALVALKVYIKLSRNWNECYTCLIGKTAIVTGANTGIGYVTALDFAKRGARVILACRDRDKAEEAQKKIKIFTGNPNVIVKIIDMQSLESVREFAEEINITEGRLDILVNNAGAAYLGNYFTEDGLQITMQTNHFSQFLLTHLLMDKLIDSGPSRIVNVTSSAVNYFADFDPDTINEYPEGGERTLYANSKLCNILFTTELARKLDGTQVTVNCVHPGLVLTEIIRSYPPFIQLFILFIAGFFLLTPEEGAQSQIYAALSPDLDRVSGELFDNCRRREIYDSARDVVLAKKVWAKSEELVKLNSAEQIYNINESFSLLSF